jgi:hypothetical protein
LLQAVLVRLERRSVPPTALWYWPAVS